MILSDNRRFFRKITMKTLHLSVDLQNCFSLMRPGLLSCWGPVKEQTLLLDTALQKFDVPTASISFSFQFVPFEEGIGHYRDTPKETQAILDGNERVRFSMPVSPFSLVGYKTGCSAQRQTEIDGYVSRKGVKRLILSGFTEADTEETWGCCISQTARDFIDAGCEVIIAAEATHRGVESAVTEYRALTERQALHRKFGVDVAPIENILSVFRHG